MEKLIAFLNHAKIHQMIKDLAAAASGPAGWSAARQKAADKPLEGQLLNCLEMAIKDTAVTFLDREEQADVGEVLILALARIEKLYGKTALFTVLCKALEQGMPEAAMVYFSESLQEQCRKPENAALREFLVREGLTLTEDGATAETGLAAVYSGVAEDFDGREDYPKALFWYQKAVTIYENTLGQEHLDTAAAYTSTAYVCKNLGDYPQALAWLQKAAAAYEKLLGAEHPGTLGVYSDIAWVCDALGDYTKALDWLHKVLAVCEKEFGVEHIETAAIYNNIAGVMRKTGDRAAALEWYQKALTISAKVLGPEHQYTAGIQDNIAAINVAAIIHGG